MAGAAQLAVRCEDNVLVDFPSPLQPITSIRSTLITSSLASLRLRNLLPRYEAAQQSPHRDTILRCVAGAWLPLEVGFAHYRACDALGLSPEEQVEIGKDVSRRVHDTFLSTVARVARGAGVTPWLLLAKGNTLQGRLYRGGGMRIVRLAAKSARVELARHGLLDLPYYRHAVLGVYTAGVELLGSNVSCRILKAESSDPARMLVLRIDWE
jgi:hypothetical protein